MNANRQVVIDWTDFHLKKVDSMTRLPVTYNGYLNNALLGDGSLVTDLAPRAWINPDDLNQGRYSPPTLHSISDCPPSVNSIEPFPPTPRPNEPRHSTFSDLPNRRSFTLR